VSGISGLQRGGVLRRAYEYEGWITWEDIVVEADPKDDYVVFFATAKASLMGQAYLLTGDIEDASDLVQEVLLRAWKAWPRLVEYEDPERWARRVLHNLAVSRWRKERVRRLSRLPAPREVAGPDAAHIDLVNALRRLPMDQQRALVLHDVAGLSVVQVADEIGAPEGTVRSWLSRGRNALARDLGIASQALIPEIVSREHMSEEDVSSESMSPEKESS
jgi:RNA polymerase sigma-70 factor, ECF subfamily